MIYLNRNAAISTVRSGHYHVIGLNENILKFRTMKDVVETLLHELCHLNLVQSEKQVGTRYL